MEGSQLLIELQDNTNQTILSVLGIQRDTSRYSVYVNKSATIDINGTAQPNIVYLGNDFNLDTNIIFAQSIVNGKVIFDTKFLSCKMGIKISVFDNNNNQLNAEDLLGVTFLINNQTYYPKMDGTIRTSVADNLSNVFLKITVDTANNTSLSTGNYKIRIEAFGSPDGICYGAETPGYAEMAFTLINGEYGLKVWTDDNSKIVDKETGNTLNGDNEILANIDYTSLLANPNITVSLERRKYDTIYAMEYEKVDLQDYVTTVLLAAENGNEYEVTSSPIANDTFLLALKNELTTGTYKLVFKLYDGKNYIGEAYDYIIIK